MKFLRFIILLALPAYILSCKPQQKIPFYLDKVNDTTGKREIKIPEILIRKGDQLSIQIVSVASSKFPMVDADFNQPISANSAQSGISAGYLVDEDGNIVHHRLGVIHAEGLTKRQLAAEVRKRLLEPVALLNEPTVVVRLLNFKITILGEVKNEGVIDIPTEKVNIFQAIGLAGGIPDYGKRDEIKIVREINGQQEVGYIDLTSKDVFDSPYYYLMQNDMLIIGSTKRKVRDEEQIRTFQKISYAFTLVTVAATIANIFIR
jgi:polysaccharide export outer membrane protein